MIQGDKVTFRNSFTCGLTARSGGTLHVAKGEAAVVKKAYRGGTVTVEVRATEKLSPSDAGTRFTHRIKVPKEILECQTLSPSVSKEDDMSSYGRETPGGSAAGTATE